MKRVGIFGGSFNPIHNGHVALARALTEGRWVDEVWLVVSPLNPLKQGGPPPVDENMRVAMARAAVAGVSGIEVCDVELRLPRPSYTWRTMETLEARHPNCAFTLVIGADNWQRLPQWQRSDELLRRYPFVVYPRTGVQVDESQLPASVRLLHLELLPWSSTQVRERVAQGLPVDDMVPPAVAQFIGRNGLYREN